MNRELLFDAKMVVCIGAGGVGKTSISAALGLANARLKRKTLVLTIDPAKRLANALGLDKSLAMPTQVPGYPLFFAMMFDVEKGWQDLLSRELGKSYFNSNLRYNRFFGHLSKDLPGSHEFIACDEVYRILTNSDFDLVILDTPPASQGLQFLNAPQKLVNFFENELFRTLLRSKGLLSRASFGLFDRSSTLIKKSLKYFAEGSFIDEMFDFIYLLRDLYPVMSKRSQEFQEVLAARTTQYVIIARPLKAPLLEAQQLNQDLAAKGYRSGLLVLNQVSPLFRHENLFELPTDEIFKLESKRAAIERLLWQNTLAQNTFRQTCISIPRLASHNHPLERIAQITEKLQDAFHEETGSRD